MPRRKRKSGDKLSHEQHDALRSDAHAFLRFARSIYLEVKDRQLNTLDSLNDMRVIWTNTGFSLELMLKWVLYSDRGEVCDAHREHDLLSIYRALSPKPKEALDKLYSGEMTFAMPMGVTMLEFQKVSGSPETSLKLPKSYYAPLKTLHHMLKFIDDHGLLYGMRYSSVSHNSSEWNIFVTGLDHLHGFTNGLARLVKFPNGNWGFEDGIWRGHGVQRSRRTPEEICEFFKRTGWKSDKEGRWTQFTPDGRVVIYAPEQYVDAVQALGEQLMTKENPYLLASQRSSRDGGYSAPTPIAELIVCNDAVSAK